MQCGLHVNAGSSASESVLTHRISHICHVIIGQVQASWGLRKADGKPGAVQSSYLRAEFQTALTEACWSMVDALATGHRGQTQKQQASWGGREDPFAGEQCCS